MDPKRTREALDRLEGTQLMNDGRWALSTVIAAAQWAVDLFEECQECGGFGFTWTPRTAISKSVKQPCPACEGRGFSLNQERFDAAWPKAMTKIGAFLHPRLVAAGNPIDITSGEMGELAKAAAEAAILAFLLGGEK